MNKLLLAIPFGYFLKTRMNTRAAVLFHGYAEYLLGFLLLWYAGQTPDAAVKSFTLSYLAFISLYEIGYIFNDFVSVRFEKEPRKRLESWNPSTLLIVVWMLIRITCFVIISFYLGVLRSSIWFNFYALLILVFALHNGLNKKQYKIFTFITLAFMRFYAPLISSLSLSFIVLSLPAIGLHYVFFRTLTYLDSKGLLNIPERNSLSFKFVFYTLSLPLSLLFFVLSNNQLCLWLNFYFLFFWGGLLALDKLNLIKVKGLKTD